MTPWLFKWLYNKDEEGNQLIPFGCELKSINFTDENPFKEELKKKLIEYIRGL